MPNEKWLIQLEAYLDGELSSAERAEFEHVVAADATLQGEMEARLALRREWRSALDDEPPICAEALLLQVRTTRPAGRRPTAQLLPFSRQRSTRAATTALPWFTWVAPALAAGVALVLYLQPWLRHPTGAAGPRSIITTAGQVAASRYGEIPGHSVTPPTGFLQIPMEN
jgi:anti-sigma factor RsiW